MQKRCFCFLLSVVVLSVTGGMVNAGWWSGALEDIVISDPDDGFSVNPPAVFCGLNGRMFAAWQQLGKFGVYEVDKVSSEVIVTPARDINFHEYSTGINYKKQAVSFPGSFNPDCTSCSIDVAVGPKGEYYAVWSQEVEYGAERMKRIFFGYCDHESNGGMWSSRLEDFIVSNESTGGDAFSPKIAVGKDGYLYLVWAQIHEDGKITVDTCVLVPVEEFPGYVITNHDDSREVFSPDEFGGLDIDCHKNHACVVWVDFYIRSCVCYSLCDAEGHYYDTDFAYETALYEDFEGISIEASPASSAHSYQNNEDSDGGSPDTSIFHAVFGREMMYHGHTLNYIKAVVENDIIHWESPVNLLNTFAVDGDMDPSLAISEDEMLHVAWRGKLDGAARRECYYTYSTDGGSNWWSEEKNYEIISWDDPDNNFEVKSPSITLDSTYNPYVVWREKNVSGLEYEIHISAYHE